MSWLGTTLILLGIILLVIVLYRALQPHRMVRWSAKARCPKTQNMATLTVIEDLDDRRAVDIIRCSELIDPDHVDCTKTCLTDINLVREKHLLTDSRLQA